MTKIFRSKKKILVILSSLFFLIMVLVAFFNEDGILAVYHFNQEILAIKIKNKKLIEENDQIKKDIQTLKTEPYAIEKIAREKLNLIKPGETVYQIVRKRESLPSH